MCFDAKPNDCTSMSKMAGACEQMFMRQYCRHTCGFCAAGAARPGAGA